MLAYIGKYPHTISVLQNSSIYRVFYMSQKGTFSSPEKRQERNEYVIGHVTCNSCLVFWFCAHGHAYYCFTLFLFIKKPLLLVKLWNHNGYCGKVKRLIHFYCCVSPKIISSAPSSETALPALCITWVDGKHRQSCTSHRVGSSAYYDQCLLGSDRISSLQKTVHM